MSKSSTATAQKNPPQLSTRSAWAKGPPNTSLPTSRSQSPAPSTSSHHTHSRRPSTLGQGVPIKDGVSVPRGNVGAVKQGSAVTFGSIDDVSAPISSSPSAAPPIKSEVKSFGSVPATVGHVNGKPSISSRPPLAPSSTSPAPTAASSTTSSTASSITSSTTLSATPSTAPSTAPPSVAPPKPRKADILKMFQNPSSVPSSQPSSDASSPSPRPSNLPAQSSTQSQSAQGPSSQPSHQYPAFVSANSMRPQNSGPGGGAPRSPVYSRQMPNGSGSRPQGGPNGGPSQLPPGMSSPRLAPHPHPGQPPNMSSQPPIQPQMQPQMPIPGWPGYYYPPQPEQHYMAQYGHPWYPMSQQMSQPTHSQHHPSPSGPHGSSHVGMPMSPRNLPPPLPPGTPSQPHAVPVMHAHHPPPPHSHSTSNSISGMSSPPPTPSTAAIPGSARLNANSSAFVPGRSKITVKNADGLEVDLGAMTKSSPASTVAPSAAPSASGFRQGSPGITATPSRRPLSIRLETVEQRQKRIAEDEAKEKESAKAKADVEKAKRDKEAKDREEERKRGEEEDRRKEEEEKKERALKEAEEEKERTRVQEEQERIRKEEEEKERLRKEEEDRKAKEEEEEKEQLRLAQEQERIKAEDEERIRVQEEEASHPAKALALHTEPRPEDSESQSVPEDGEVQDADEGDVETPDAGQEHKEKAKEILRINTSPVSELKKRPGPLDLSNTRNASPSLPSALATARVIDDLGSVPYPEGISSPNMELNVNAKNGKFRYDRDFLLQFMSICKEKPDMLPPLDAIGLEPTDQLSLSRGGSGRHRQSSGASAPSRQTSVGLGFSGGFSKTGASNFNMGSFAPPSKLSSDERFNLSTTGRAASVSGATLPFNRPSPMQRTASQGGPSGVPMSSHRVRSKRGEKRNDSNKVGNSQSGHGFSHGQSNMGQGISFEPVVPLQASANRWDRRVAATVDPDSPEIVDRKVKGLLNKLTMEKFDSISDQIIAWANRSEKEKDGRTLIQVIRLVFEKATDEATWSEMYARLCRKMMEQISPSVQDDGIKNTEGKPIAGGQLFRKYLLNRCQEDFERGWVAKETTAAAAATKALEDQAAKAANEKAKDGENEEIVLYSEEYYAAQKAKRQGLGLIKFIGELFKLQMLTERIMHECVKKLLGNVENPEEEEIESLCKLLSTVGAILDTPKARAHMDVYFSRMRELTKSQNVSSRMQFMLQDLLELRERKWVSRNAVAAPATIAQIHEAAAKEKAAQDKESYQRQMSMSRGGSRRGGDRGDFAQVGPDGWAVAGNGPPRPPPKAGDLSKFGQISKPSSTMTFGPGSVFAGKKESKRESLSRTSSNSNMFSMLSQNAEIAADASSQGVPEPLAQRKRLILQPRTKPSEEEQEAVAPTAESESSEDDTVMEAPSEMTEDEAKRKIAEDSKEFFSVRNLDEAEVYFTNLPPVHHFRLVDTLANSAVESKESDAQLVSEFFARAATKKLCTPAAFEDGLSPISEAIDDIAIDAPKAFTLFAIMVKGAGFDEERQTRLASKSTANERLLALLS